MRSDSIKLMDKELVAVLNSVGFTEKEALVYIALLSLGAGTVQEVAKLSGLKRPIIYVILEGLIQRGYASAVPGKKVHTFQAADASVVLRRLQASVTNLNQYLPIFRTLGNRGTSRPKISYLDTKEQILNIYEEINHDPAPLFITSYARLNSHFPGVVGQWVKGIEKGAYKLRGTHIVPDNEDELELVRDFKKVNQRVRVWPALRGVKMDLSIYGNKIAITNLGEELFAVVIESEDIANALRPLFDAAWKAAGEVK